MVWIAIAGMTAVALWLLLPPLLRREADAPPRAEFDARVYREQLAELERDAERGVISGAEAEAARTEIARRLLAADDAAKADEAPPSQGGRSALVAVAVALCVPVLALAAYLAGGAPQLSDRAAIRAEAPAAGRDVESLVAELGERLKDRPNDARGWTLYANSLARLGRVGEAVPAYRHAVRLDPDNAELQSRFGEALSIAGGGTVPADAVAAFERALALAPGEPRARYYLGLAANQAGRREEALTRWLALEAGSPPDAPWRRILDERIAALATEMGLDGARLAARRAEAAKEAGSKPVADFPSVPAERGPSAADVEAAQSMSAEDRAGMIRGMVAGLAERLEKEPDDATGWARLARSYDVLGEAEKARAAHARVAALKPNDAEALAGYAAAIVRGLGPGEAAPEELGRIADRILSLDPDHTGGLWFAGLARARAGDAAGARAHWSKLLARLPADSPPARELKQRIDALESGSGGR